MKQVIYLFEYILMSCILKVLFQHFWLKLKILQLNAVKKRQAD